MAMSSSLSFFWCAIAWIAIFAAAIFVFVQLVLLVDFAHSWNEAWVENFEETDSKSWYNGFSVL